MTDDLAVLLRDELGTRVGDAQVIDEGGDGLALVAERRGHHLPHRGLVLGPVGADLHVSPRGS